jgi:lysophospholipase L1-like esterase
MGALPVAGLAVLVSQVFRIAHPPHLPAFPNQDLSGTFGDPELPQLRIVAIGDSSLTAPGVTDIDATWIRQAARSLSDRYQVELMSVAVGGSKVRDVMRDQVDAALALSPDIVMLAAGANDAIRIVPMWLIRREIRNLVAALHAEAGAVVLLGVGDLGTIPRLPAWLSHLLRWRGRLLDDAINRVAADYDKASVVPSEPISAEFREGGLEMFSGDLFHSSEAGQAAFVRQVIPTFERALAIYEAGPGPH